MADYANFRQRLDTVLRTKDVKQVSDFLIAEKQWSAGTPANPEFAMWMMVAGSPTLRDLHDQAWNWLISHGHEIEATALLAREKRQNTKSGGGKQRSHGAPSKGGKSAKKNIGHI